MHKYKKRAPLSKVPNSNFSSGHYTSDSLIYQRKLFPLNGKLPAVKGWRDASFTPDQLANFGSTGTGWALGPCDLVIDVDVATEQKPDKQGAASLQKLIDLIGLDVFESAPMVQSPSGGVHYYFCKRGDTKFRKVLKDEYPGIDFITEGGFVVTAGSEHPNGGTYKLAQDGNRPMCPDALATLLTRKPKLDTEIPASSIGTEQLATLLATVDVMDYSQYEDWFRILASCHNATGGSDEGFRVFWDWCTGNPEYANDEWCNAVLTKWQSLDGGTEQPITIGTLLGAADNMTVAQIEFADGTKPRVPVGDFKPDDIASIFIEATPGCQHVNGAWYLWKGTHYEKHNDKEFKNVFVKLCDARFSGLRDSLLNSAITIARARLARLSTEPQFWLSQPVGDLANSKACDLLPTKSGFVDINSKRVFENTLALFCTDAIDADMSQTSATRWLSFLDEVFDRDEETIEALQMWFGYCLTNDFQYHKLLLLLGRTRSGKGTIANVLSALVGPSQMTAPEINDLGKPFGLQSLIGKKLCIDADNRGYIDDGTLAVLLKITGGDVVTVNIKYKDPVEVQLTTKVMVCSNESLRLTDNSSALCARLLALQTVGSMLDDGKTLDADLPKKLRAELAGILLWAIDGLHSLRQKGFKQPHVSKGVLDEVQQSASPMAVFLDECCELNESASVPLDKFRVAYRDWCFESGRKPGNDATIGRALSAVAGDTVKKKRVTTKNGVRPWVYSGVDLLGLCQDFARTDEVVARTEYGLFG